MDQQTYREKLLSHPRLREWKIDETAKTAALNGAIENAGNRIATRYDFPFAVGIKEGETIAAQSDHVLKGKSSDAREIMRILFGTNGTLLEKLEFGEYRRTYPVTVNTTGSTRWVPIGEKNGFPHIRLLATPAAATTITYDYRKKNVKVQDVPNIWGFVVIDLALDELAGQGSVAVGGRSLQLMVDDYSRGSGEENTIIMDKHTRRRNRARNNFISGY